VTFGAGKASQVIERVPLCPSNTFVSVNDCVIVSGAKEGNVSIFHSSAYRFNLRVQAWVKRKHCDPNNTERC
jgi:hypothetical protein